MKVRFFLAACVAVMLTGCSLEQSSESPDDPRNGSDGVFDGGSAQATVAGPSWSEYMPVREGRVCEYSSDGGSGVTDEISLTQRYTDVREESDGTHFTLESTTEISTAADEQYSEAEPLYSETESLEYVLGDDGLLRSEPQLFNQGGFEADVDGFVVYPNIEEVREGKSVSSSMTASVSSSDPSIKAQIEDALEPGERELEVRMDYKVLGVPPEEISTPTGTFTDVVGASLTVEDIEFLNANEETRRDVDDMAESLTDMTGTPTVWYARDTGAVQTGIEGGMASMMGGASSMKLEGCDGEQPESPPADDDAPEEFELPEPTSPENDGNPDPSGGGEATLEE